MVRFIILLVILVLALSYFGISIRPYHRVAYRPG